MLAKSALLALLAVTLMGCSASPGAASASAAAAPVTPSPSPTPSSSPASVTSSAAATIDISTVLPKTAGGFPLDTKLIAASELARVSQGGLKGVAQIMKVDLASLRAAIGWGGASGGEQIATVVQIPGASAASMTRAFRSGIEPGAMVMGLEGTRDTVGGKSVLTFPGSPPTYVYLVADTAFVITADAAVAAEVLTALP